MFQIFLLGPFYQLIKTDQVESTAEAVLRQLDEPQDTLRQTVEDLCYDTDINILVIDENGRLLADSYASQKQSPLRMTLAQGGLPAQTILAQLYNEVNLQGQTILMVTHSVKAASHAGRVLFIKDGELFHQIYRGESTENQFYQKISDALTLLTTGGERA